MGQAKTILAPGVVGPIECLLEPDLRSTPVGVALIAHPHPLYRGNNTNKVVYALARAHAEAGFRVLRPNFRGVGQSAGVYDEGRGEAEDLIALMRWSFSVWPELPRRIALAGFSFGAYVALKAVCTIADRALFDMQWALLTLVALPHGLALGSGTRYEAPPLPEQTAARVLLIHGERDEVVPFEQLLSWARLQEELAVVLIPGADHFFHGKLILLQRLVKERLSALAFEERWFCI